MACRYTYKGKTYEAEAFFDLLSTMPPAEASKFMPTVASVPSAPFVGKTEAWAGLALRRMLRYAAEHGYQSMAWMTGDQQNERYDLSKKISRVQYAKDHNLIAYDLNGKEVITRITEPADLPDVIGKDAADKLLAQPEPNEYKPRELSGLDLKIGGSGMKGFYDDIIPAYLNKVGKKWGAAVGQIEVTVGPDPKAAAAAMRSGDSAAIGDAVSDRRMTVHSIPITDAMRKSVLTDSQVLFENRSQYETRPDEDRQLSLDFTRSALGELDRAVASVSTVRGTLDRPAGGVRVLGLGFTPELIRTGRVDLRGQRIHSPQDLARLAHVYRDPRFETFRIVYVKGREIVGHEGLTSRLANAVISFERKPGQPSDQPRRLAEARDRMRRLGATGYYLLHNHPSGKPVPSSGDLSVTETYAKGLPGFKGHVVINSGKFGFIDPDLTAVVMPLSGSQSALLDPSVPHPYLEQVIDSPESLARLAKTMQTPKDFVTLVYLAGTEGRVRMIQEIPVGLFLKTARAGEWIRGQSRMSGSARVFSVSSSDSFELHQAARMLARQGDLVDHAFTTGGTVVDEDTRQKGYQEKDARIQRQPGLRVEEEVSSYTVKQVEAYKPAKAVEKQGAHWRYQTIQGTYHPAIFETKEKAIRGAIKHQKRERKAAKEAAVTPAERHTIEQVLRDAPLNPKIEPLVWALNEANIETTLSGDLYGDKLVYVNVSEEAVSRLNESKLPNGWKLVPSHVPHIEQAILGKPLSRAHRDQEAYLRKHKAFFERTTLARKGGAVTAAEVQQIVDAFSSSDIIAEAQSSYLSEEPRRQEPLSPQRSLHLGVDSDTLRPSAGAKYGLTIQKTKDGRFTVVRKLGGENKPLAEPFATLKEAGAFVKDLVDKISAPPAYSIPEPTRLDSVIRLLQDKTIDVKRVVEAIKASGKTIADELNPVLKEEMFQGRAAKATQDFLNQELDPLLKVMAANRVTQPELNRYLHARHAKEANAYLRKINPELEQNEALSGMTDGEAATILESAPPILQRLAGKVDAIINKTRKALVDYGLESEETIDKISKVYQHYVPLDREGFEDISLPPGQGLSVRGTMVKRRLGGRDGIPSILAHVAIARERVIGRGERMKPVVAFAGMLMTHPNSELAHLDKPAQITVVDPLTGLEQTVPGDLGDYKIPRIRVFNEDKGIVEYRPDPQYKGRDNVVNFRVAGIDYAIVFSEQNRRAIEIAKGLKDLDTGELNMVMAAVAPATKFIAAASTQYNPVFGLVNGIRDVQFAMLSLGSTPLKGRRAEVFGYTLKAIKGIYSASRAVRDGKKTHSPVEELWERFQAVGGPTGYRDLYRTPEDRAKAIEHLLDPAWWQKTMVGKTLTAGGLLASPEALMYHKGLKPVLEWLSDYNLALENAVRLGVFKAGLEHGLTDLKAASLAKGITVDFNRKGQISAQMGSLYAFFNASVQGTSRMAETLFEPGKVGTLSSLGKKIVAGGVTLGVLQAFALAMAGFDEDDPPEWQRERNIIIPLPDGKFVTYPMPLGFHILPNIGRLAAEVVMYGKPTQRLAHFAGTVFEAFNPLGSAGISMQTFAPTVADPFVALGENKDWTGRKISKEDFNSLHPTPGFTRARDGASPWSLALAESINYITGGSSYRPGVVSPTAESLDYLVKAFTGGIGREVSNTAQVVSGAISGNTAPFYKIPIAGRFAGSTSGASAVRDRFYDNLKELNVLESELKGLRHDHGDVADFMAEHPEARLIGLGNTHERLVAQMVKRKRDLVRSGADREKVQELDARITDKQQRFNDRVARAGEGQRVAQVQGP